MNQYLDHIRGFGRSAWLFTIARMLFAFGTAITRVFFNLFLLASGFDAVLIGVAASIVQVGGAIFTVPAILVLDRAGRKRSAILGATISLLSWVASVMAPTPGLLLGLQLVSGLGDVLFGLAVVPLLAELSNDRERSTLFSMHDGLTFLSLFGGSLIAGPLSIAIASQLQFVPESIAAYRAVLLASVGLRLLGLLPLALVNLPAMTFGSGAPAFNRGEVNAHARQSLLKYLNPRFLRSIQTPIWKFLVPWALLYFAGALISPYYNLFLKSRFGAEDTTIGAVYSLFNLSDGAITLVGPLIAQYIQRRWLVPLCMVGSAAILIAVITGGSLEAVAAMLVVRVGLISMIVPMYKSHVMNLAPRHEYVIASFLLGLAANIGQFIGPLISGLTQRRFGGMNEVIAVSVIFSLISAGLLGWVLRPSKQTTTASK